MKHFLFTLLASLPAMAFGQGNYVRSFLARTALDADTRLNGGNAVVSTVYHDSAGRPVQTVLHGATPSRADMADFTAYDAFGQKSQVWEPVPVNLSGGGFVPADELRSVTDFHHTDYRYDALGRPTAEIGRNTAGCSVVHTYGFRAEGVCRYVRQPDGTVMNAGTYNAPLYSERSTDEDGMVLWTFRDAFGRTLLERRGNTDGQTAFSDTYFVYDAFGSLACVLPPAAAKATSTPGTYSTASCKALRDYAYFYTYDTRNNRIGTKLPGQDWRYTVYDGERRPVLVQDPNLRGDNRWKFIRYNALGQTTMEGLVRNTKSVGELVAQFRDIAVTDTYTGEGLGYGTPSDMGAVLRIDRVCYYGCHDFLRLQPFAGLGMEAGNCAPHELAGEYRSITGGEGHFELAVLDRDYRGRVTGTCTHNTLCGTVEDVHTNYSFLDMPVLEETVLNTGRETLTLRETFAYDHALRERRSDISVILEGSEEGLRTGVRTTLCETAYDAYGRPVTEKLSGDVLRSLSYRPDGKLSEISAMHFHQQLRYEDATGVPPCRNGRISMVEVEQDGKEYRFGISYDALGRYTGCADFKNPRLYERFGYDEMGNITTMQHCTSQGIVNAVEFAYDGNRMCSAATVSGKTPSLMAQKLYSSMLYPVFTDGNPYLCDANGNETRNLSHRVKEASYNTMDLPTLVTFTDGNGLRMRYTSDGRRVETLSKTWLTPLVVPADTLALRDSTLQYAQEAPSASLAASTSSTASTSSSNSGITSGRPATGITGPALYLPYRLHREWRIGDVVLEDSLISRIDIRNGSFRVERDSLGGARLACYRHVTDYLGSVRTVYRMGTSWVLTPVQHIAYLPSGAVLANSDGAVQQRMFCGKELQPLHGWKMYDSHARMQYNVLPRFSATDPLCQKYYHLSPYAYCANDPVNMVDPEGKENYNVNVNGYIYRRNDFFDFVRRFLGFAPSKDRIFMNGELLIELPRNTIEITYNKENDNNVTSLMIDSPNYGQKVFRQLIQRTNVEWAYIQYKDKRSTKCIIQTNHIVDNVTSIVDQLRRIKNRGFLIEQFDHSHPMPQNSKGTNAEYLTQLNVSQEDKETVKFFKPNISRVFNLKSRKIEYYNEKEVFKYEEMW